MLKMHNKMFHVYWYLGTAIGMNVNNLTIKRGEGSEAITPTKYYCK
jgi:hypothetical protein